MFALRMKVAVLALLPLAICLNGLAAGWIALPTGRSYTRHLQPVAYWTLIVLTALAGLTLLLGAFLF